MVIIQFRDQQSLLKCQLQVHTLNPLIIEHSLWLSDKLLGDSVQSKDQHLPCSKSNLCYFVCCLVPAVGTGRLPSLNSLLTQVAYCIAQPTAWERGGEGQGLGWGCGGLYGETLYTRMSGLVRTRLTGHLWDRLVSLTCSHPLSFSFTPTQHTHTHTHTHE